MAERKPNYITKKTDIRCPDCGFKMYKSNLELNTLVCYKCHNVIKPIRRGEGELKSG